MRRCLAGLFAGITAMVAAADHGVVLMYHHVDESTPASTSVTPAQFARQLDYIESNGFVVVPLHDLLDAAFGNGELPDNAVAITFDDAYESVYREAFPELRSRNMPFTVFVATEAVDSGYDGSLSWEQLRELTASGLASVGAHSMSHEHMLHGSEKGASDAWIARVSREIDGSVTRIEDALSDVSVRSFAYPFGEYSAALEALIADRGLYGLAQQSGAVGMTTPPTAIPRFPLASGYASTERLAMALNTRPLPVQAVEPENTFIDGKTATPAVMRFSLVDGDAYQRDALACYSASGKTLAVTRDADHIAVSLPPMNAGRNKINCTAPSTERRGEFFWYARQWVVADDQGAWLKY